MKRVNSESNTKQGLSIAESCASSTTVKTKKTYSEIADLRYKVQNPILREQANRYGIITAVRDLRMTLLSGLMKDVLLWQTILTGTEDGAIVCDVWHWLFGKYPTFVTQTDRNTGAILDAWVAEN